MKINEEQIDDVVLALLQLTAHSDGYSTRAWKGQSWEVMNRLHEKGWISNPKGKAKSVMFTKEGLIRSEFLFNQIFCDETAPASTSPKNMQTRKPIRIRISLQGCDPDIWREVCIPGDLSLGELHHVIQIAMGWYNCHLHLFMHKKKVYGEPSPDDWQEVLDENEVSVSDIFLRKGSRIEYEYDLGDGWIHDIVSLGYAAKDAPLFQVTDGAMACPPEDCGGIWGYEDLREALADPKHPEHQSLAMWAGPGFDPEAFDLKKVNKRLKQLVKNKGTA